MSFVLIIEPDEVNAARIRTILESLEQEFEYALVMTEEEAIASVEREKPDVFIGDMQLPVMRGSELFSMIQMMSPETVCIVMTDGTKIQETVAFMNECRIFKIIIKPCRMAEDLLNPTQAALAYKKQRERRRLANAQVHTEQAALEEALTEAEKIWQRQQGVWKQKLQYMQLLLAENIEADTQMEAKVRERLKRWYQWMLEEYLRLLVNGSGSYEQVLRAQTAFCHAPDKHCFFQMKKQTSNAIEPQCMNEIAYILRLVTGVCKDLQNRYLVQALIEETPKAYILRVRFELEKDENGRESVSAQRVRDIQIRRCVSRATKLAIAALGAKSAVVKKETADIVNFAVAR